MWIKLKLTPREPLAKVVTAEVKRHSEDTAKTGHMNTVGSHTHKT